MKNIFLAQKIRIFIIFLLSIVIITIITSCTIKLPAAKTQETTVKGQIVFASSRDINYEIFIMNADSSGQVNLTNNPAF